MKQTSLALLVIGALVWQTGCTTTPAQRGALGGGAIGAAAGQILGDDTESTLLGAGIGALSGAMANDYIDSQKRASYRSGYAAGQYTPPPPPPPRPAYSQPAYIKKEVYYYQAPPPPPPGAYNLHP